MTIPTTSYGCECAPPELQRRIREWIEQQPIHYPYQKPYTGPPFIYTCPPQTLPKRPPAMRPDEV